MGYQHVSMNVTARVSRHNSDADVYDDALWEQLQDEILALTMQEKYETLRVITLGAGSQ